MGSWGSGLDAHDPEALREYERVFADPAARHAMLEDYRAGASVDLEHDAASAAAGDRITAPCLVLWGERGVVGSNPVSPLEVWRGLAEPGLVTGAAVPGAGHFLAEENHADTLAALQAFLRGRASSPSPGTPARRYRRTGACAGRPRSQDVCMSAQPAPAQCPPSVVDGAA